MTIRTRCLSSGWYPSSAEQIARFLAGFEKHDDECPAVAAPHASWHYSGAVAARAVAALRRSADTVVVLGGHLPGGFPPLYAEEDAVFLPQDCMEFDDEFRALLIRELPGKGDRFQDNTVEVLLPMVRHFFPAARLLWLRLPADRTSFEAGRIIARVGAELGRNFVVLGSTDLTHYGENYDFAPHGTGLSALDWVKTKNDRNFITAVLAGDAGDALRRAEEEKSACSPGPVLACMGYAGAARAGSALLLDYATSADVSIAGGEGIPASFVGYAALGWME
jgi:AmmeMemoRadiSam system protein B